MNINGAAFGQRVGGGGQAGRGGNSPEGQIRRLQAKRAEYLKKLQNVKEEATSADHAKRLTEMYQNAIAGINMQISQLQKQKAEAAQRKTEEAGKSDTAEKSGKTESAEEVRSPSDPFGEERSGMRLDDANDISGRKKGGKWKSLGLFVDFLV